MLMRRKRCGNFIGYLVVIPNPIALLPAL